MPLFCRYYCTNLVLHPKVSRSEKNNCPHVRSKSRNHWNCWVRLAWKMSYRYAALLYCTVLYCTVLYCTVLYCTDVLYCYAVLLCYTVVALTDCVVLCGPCLHCFTGWGTRRNSYVVASRIECMDDHGRQTRDCRSHQSPVWIAVR